MTIYITQEDLDKVTVSGTWLHSVCATCPFAIALGRTFGVPFWASYIRFVPFDQGHLECSHELTFNPSDEMKMFMKSYDEGGPVSPRSFEIPDEIAAKWTAYGQTGRVQ